MPLRQDSWGKTEAIIYVTAAQLVCGIAKDLTKLGGKTVTKLVTPGETCPFRQGGLSPDRSSENRGMRRISGGCCHPLRTPGRCRLGRDVAPAPTAPARAPP